MSPPARKPTESRSTGFRSVSPPIKQSSFRHIIKIRVITMCTEQPNCDALIHTVIMVSEHENARLLLRSKISCLEPSSHLCSTPSNLPNQSAWTQVSRSTALRPIHSKANAKYLFFYFILFIFILFYLFVSNQSGFDTETFITFFFFFFLRAQTTRWCQHHHQSSWTFRHSSHQVCFLLIQFLFFSCSLRNCRTCFISALQVF